MDAVVSYVYAVDKKDFWDVVRQVRDYYKANHVLYNLSFNVENISPDEQYQIAVKTLMNFKGHGAEIQLFDRNANQYVFRMLERNYFFLDAFRAKDWKIQQRFYDNQTDLLVMRDPKNLELAEWIDKKIEAQEYFIVPIMTTETLQKYYFGKLMNV